MTVNQTEHKTKHLAELVVPVYKNLVLDKMLNTRLILLSLLVCVNLSSSQQLIGTACTLKRSNVPGNCQLLTDCKQVRDEILTLHRLPETCGFQGTQSIVCCPLVKQPGDISKEKCKEYSSYAYEDGDTKNECGHRIRKRIVGGVRVNRKEFPHMAALGFNNGENGISWRCGGSIISEQFILTVAHCVRNREGEEPKVARVGVVNLNDSDHRQDLKIVEIIVYPEYKPQYAENDIALLKLEKPIKLSSYARPACLSLDVQTPVGSATATGWGKTDFTSSTESNDLLKVSLRYMDYDNCNMAYKNFRRKLPNGIRSDIHLCAGEPSTQKDTCQGDAGGPLQIHHNGDDIKCMYDIVGLTSFGKGCSGGPSIYTRVSYYIRWIEKIVWDNK